MIITVKAGNSPVGGIVDGLAAGSLRGQPEAERVRIEGDLREIQAVYDDAADTLDKAQQSRELSPTGMTAKADKVINGAFTALKPHAAKAERYRADAASMRAKALAPPATERTPEAIAREREIRDRLTALADHERVIRYLVAIENADWETVRAVEGAPAAFPLVSPDTRQQGDKIKLGRSPLASQLAAAEALAGMYSSILATAQTELRRLAARHGAQLDSTVVNKE